MRAPAPPSGPAANPWAPPGWQTYKPPPFVNAPAKAPPSRGPAKAPPKAPPRAPARKPAPTRPAPKKPSGSPQQKAALISQADGIARQVTADKKILVGLEAQLAAARKAQSATTSASRSATAASARTGTAAAATGPKVTGTAAGGATGRPGSSSSSAARVTQLTAAVNAMKSKIATLQGQENALRAQAAKIP